MTWTSILGCAALAGAQLFPVAANAAAQTYHYAVAHARYGPIGTYDRTIDDTAGVTRAQSRLRIAVTFLGIVVHREDADQSESWRGKRLISFQSVTTTNGSQVSVSGAARDDRFLVTSPSGTTAAPADVVASDPWSLTRMGAGVVVSIKSGKIVPVMVTGGETAVVTLNGLPTRTHHFHIAAAGQPNKWEVWIDDHGTPVEFQSLETGGAVNFALVSSTQPAGGALGPLAVGSVMSGLGDR